jgi:endonuclease YncB( thermonuclease family)
MGILRVRGEIELDQFWPDGSADADTTKIKVTVDSGAFAYAKDGKNFKTTKVFIGAVTKGRGSNPAIDSKNRITVRLQGIDAPELHYKASAIPNSAGISKVKRQSFNAANKKRRQHWAESATLALADKLSNFGERTIACEFVSLVDRPTDVVDTYGRFVGNIKVGANFRVDVNLWLMEEGWTFPAYYTSMTPDEINKLSAAAKKGRRKKRIWKDYSEDARKFESKLLYRPKGPAGDIGDDAGEVLMPKLYRRQVAFRMQKLAVIIDGSFADYLAGQTSDRYLTLEDFLVHGPLSAEPHYLDELLDGKKLTADPEELVFTEAASRLVDKKGNLLVKF